MQLRRPDSGVIVPVLVCLALGALGGVATALVTKPEAHAQPARFTVPRQPPPHFRLRDETGTWRTPASARGEVLLVTFIYTNCKDLCPRQAAEIKEAVLAAGGGVQVYAITVDPEHDTPEQAQAWLQRMGVAGGPVHILLGSRRQLPRPPAPRRRARLRAQRLRALDRQARAPARRLPVRADHLRRPAGGPARAQVPGLTASLVCGAHDRPAARSRHRSPPHRRSVGDARRLLPGDARRGLARAAALF